MYKEYYKRVMDSQVQGGQCTSSIWKQLDSDKIELGSLVSELVVCEYQLCILKFGILPSEM